MKRIGILALFLTGLCAALGLVLILLTCLTYGGQWIPDTFSQLRLR